jgi:hypothetical protein
VNCGTRLAPWASCWKSFWHRLLGLDSSQHSLRFHSLFNVRVIIRLKYETSSYLVIYYNIFQFFLQKRYSEADFFMKVAWKIALYNLVFHQLPLIQHCNIFYKKNAFQSTKNFRRIQWQNMLRMASECISYNLEFQNFLQEDPCIPHLPESGKPPSRALPHLHLQHSVRASGTQVSPYFINWDSYNVLQFFSRTLLGIFR